MNYMESNKLVLTDVLKTFSYDAQHAQIIDDMASSCPQDAATSDVVNALAWWIAKDLYSDASTDQVNLERIAFGLESASRQLLSLSTRLRDISGNLQSTTAV